MKRLDGVLKSIETRFVPMNNLASWNGLAIAMENDAEVLVFFKEATHVVNVVPMRR